MSPRLRWVRPRRPRRSILRSKHRRLQRTRAPSRPRRRRRLPGRRRRPWRARPPRESRPLSRRSTRDPRSPRRVRAPVASSASARVRPAPRQRAEGAGAATGRRRGPRSGGRGSVPDSRDRHEPAGRASRAPHRFRQPVRPLSVRSRAPATRARAACEPPQGARTTRTEGPSTCRRAGGGRAPQRTRSSVAEGPPSASCGRRSG